MRGLRIPAGQYAERVRERLTRGAEALRSKLEEHALPVLQGWYGRLRRDHVTTDACTVAAHMAFVFVGVGDEPGPHAIDQRSLFVLLSSRVFLNVHHDFELEPEIGLPGQPPPPPSKGPRKKLEGTQRWALGFQPLDVFDLWQAHLGRQLRWLGSNAERGSDVLEGVVRLLSGSAPWPYPCPYPCPYSYP